MTQPCTSENDKEVIASQIQQLEGRLVAAAQDEKEAICRAKEVKDLLTNKLNKLESKLSSAKQRIETALASSPTLSRTRNSSMASVGSPIPLRTNPTSFPDTVEGNGKLYNQFTDLALLVTSLEPTHILAEEYRRIADGRMVHTLPSGSVTKPLENVLSTVGDALEGIKIAENNNGSRFATCMSAQMWSLIEQLAAARKDECLTMLAEDDGETVDDRKLDNRRRIEQAEKSVSHLEQSLKAVNQEKGVLQKARIEKSLAKAAQEDFVEEVPELKEVIAIEIAEEALPQELETMCRNLNLELEWNVRIDAMRQLRCLVAGGVCSFPSFLEVATTAGVLSGVASQVGDLRSQVVKEASETISELATALKTDMQPVLVDIMGPLMAGLAVTVKVMHESADSAIRSILTLVPGASVVVSSVLGGLQQKSHSVRAKCSEYLLLILQKWAPELLKKYLEQIEESILSAISDANKDVRATMKQCFIEHKRIWPTRTDELFEKLSPAAKKLVSDSNRVGKAPKRPRLDIRAMKAQFKANTNKDNANDDVMVL